MRTGRVARMNHRLEGAKDNPKFQREWMSPKARVKTELKDKPESGGQVVS